MTIAVPLSRKAVLVSVNISTWTARKLDKKVTKEVNESHGAASDAGRYNKLLIEAERLAKLNSLDSAARTLHYAMTMPWSDKGPRILPNTLYREFADKFRAIVREFKAEADIFAREFPQYIEERRIKLNGLFNPNDYPAANQIRDKFQMDFNIMQFPEDSTDFRADLDEDTLADIRAELKASSGRALDVATKNTITRVSEVVGHLATKLKEYKVGVPGERNWFTDSTVENVRELADLLPAFNLTDNPDLDRITKRIKAELCVEEAKELRKNPVAREIVAKSAEEIVAEVQKFFG